MNRKEQIDKVKDGRLWDILVIGGGATGLGIAVDAASRGYAVALVEKDDFAKGTSSRSTKLLHGGVRYLAQGNVKLVMEALRERGILLKNAPHLSGRQAFVVPAFSLWDFIFYGTGLGIYDILAGKLQIGSVRFLGRKSIRAAMPGLSERNIYGGVEYVDGQFDDARLALVLAQTAVDQGACVVNYMEVEELIKAEQKVSGVRCYDRISGESFAVQAKAVINATGVFADDIIHMDQPDAKRMLSPSQGIHIVVDRDHFPGDRALMIPKTDDGRVLFAVPWHGKLVVGTTDTAVDTVREEPVALKEEIDYVISHFNRYARLQISRKDIRSVFAGLRPLVKTANSGPTSLISRDHTIVVSPAGLITITGGKWTTYRKMARDAVQNAIFVGKLDRRPCVTEDLALHGRTEQLEAGHLSVYGADAERIIRLAGEHSLLAERVHPQHPYLMAEVVWAVREEMAMTLEDVLSRRIRLLFLDARAAVEAAEGVAAVMAGEMGLDKNWEMEEVRLFREVADTYIVSD